MGSVLAKSSTPQNLVQPSEPAKPPAASPHAQCLATTKVSHAEWDECMRQSALTLGTTTMTAIAIGLMVPAADTLLLLGTGAGVLWSVKRCRTIMRDGILSPQETKALEHKKRAEREEKRRQTKMEKEAKQKAAAERKSLGKQKNVENKKSNSKDCCAKVKKALEQKGINVDDLPCDKVSHKNEGSRFNVEEAVAIGRHSAGDLAVQPQTFKENLTHLGAIKVSYSDRKGELHKIHSKESEMEQMKSSTPKNPLMSKEKLLDVGPYSTVKIFASHLRQMSESVILTCGDKECTCNATKVDCACEPERVLDEEPQQYTLATDVENKDSTEQEDPVNLNVQLVNSVEDTAERGNHPNRILAESNQPEDCFKDTAMEQPVAEEGQPPAQEPEQDEEDVEIATPPVSKRTEPHNDDTVELILEDTEDVDVKIAELPDGVDVEVIKHEIDSSRTEQPTNEVDVVFAETHKSESWPFSFSLPSLDKFSKKKNNSFKWPPLTSSIIVKPKKEPTCKCPDGLGTKESEEEHKKCTCGLEKNDCTCP